MYLLAGLGNPGPRYAQNRHNVGFMIAERVRETMTGAGPFREKFSGEIAKGTLAGQELVVLRPLTYMNLSGRSVQRASAFFQIEISRIIVVHDELDLPWKTVRVKTGGGTAGHNGLKSIAECLGSPDFLRVRVGIGRPVHGTGEEYVLSDFDPLERAELADVVDRARLAVETILARGAPRAMNEFNTKQREKKET